MLPFNDFFLKKVQQQKNFEFFYGSIHKVGGCVASVRNTKVTPHYTVIGVHGFLCDHRYFTPLYPQMEVELILMSNSGYHVPVAQKHFDTPDWYRPIPYKRSTLEYDAAALCQVLENLPTTENVRVHGHSRGGAIVLEASRQRPDLFVGVEVLLEAPILPKTKRNPLTRVWAKKPLLWMAPYYGTLLGPLSDKVDKAPMGAFGDLSPEMCKFLLTMVSSPKHYECVVNNVESFERWTKLHGYELYRNISHGTILVPRADRVLDRTTMLESAKHAGPNMNVVETPASSHFLALENRGWLPPLQKKMVTN